MAYDECNTYVFGYQAVQDKAPSESGVYTIYSARRWVYVGESQDIRQSLFGHLNEPDTCIGRWGPLSFSFETIPTADRGSRRHALVAELQPVCNLEKG